MHSALIIDSEAEVLERFKASPEGGHFKPHVVENGYEAVDLIEVIRPSLAILDISAPGRDNIEVLRNLKEIDPDLEVIVIVARQDALDPLEALELGASDCVSRPVSRRALDVALRRAKERIWTRARLKDAMDEIQKRQDFEHKLILTSMDGIIANDRKGNILLFNDGASRIYGYTREEALSQLHVTQLYPEGEARRIKKQIYSDAYGGPGLLINYEAQALTKEKTLTPILLSATLIHEGGQEIATVGYFKDLTEIRLQRARLLRIEETLKDIASQAREAMDDLSLAVSMVDQALAGGEQESIRRGWSLVKAKIDRVSRLIQLAESACPENP
jgi:PAS domain S-box-containing protein